MNEDEKTILCGRIYPALQSCVRYRYLILAGYLVAFAYIRNNIDLLKTFGDKRIFFILWVLFWLAILAHNLRNYYQNAKAEYEIERSGDFKTGKPIEMEWFFIFIFLGLLAATSYSLWCMQPNLGTTSSTTSISMSANGQFWWNWWVNCAMAMATFMAVLAALFKRNVLNKIFSSTAFIKAAFATRRS